MTQLYADEQYIYVCGETTTYYDVLRTLGGGKWRSDLKCWRFPKSKYTVLIKLFGEEITEGLHSEHIQEIKLVIIGSQIHVSGDTFDLKNCFKHMGGIWNQDHWAFPVDRLDLLRNFIRLGKISLVEEQMSVPPPKLVAPQIAPPRISPPQIMPPKLVVPPPIPTPTSGTESPQFVITKSHKGIWACHISPQLIVKVPGSKWNATRKCYIYSVKKDLKSLMSAFGLSENDF